MTIDEAIEILKDGKLNPCVTEDREACDMAIKALEQESCKDAVSRQAVLNTLDFTDKFLDETRTVESYKTLLEECYKNLPSVTPTRKKGKWIGHGEHCENLGVIPSGLGAYEWCSNCDCGIDVREWHRNHYNYCPNCGAEMESE